MKQVEADLKAEIEKVGEDIEEAKLEWRDTERWLDTKYRFAEKKLREKAQLFAMRTLMERQRMRELARVFYRRLVLNGAVEGLRELYKREFNGVKGGVLAFD